MAYDESLANRIRKNLPKKKKFSEKKMFGGIAFFLNGKMMVGVIKSRLMVRCNKEDWLDFLKKPHVREMDFTGKSLKGFLYIDSKGFASDKDLQFWMNQSIAFVEAL